MMKPLRALAGVGLLALGWLGARLPEMHAELLADTTPWPEMTPPQQRRRIVTAAPGRSNAKRDPVVMATSDAEPVRAKPTSKPQPDDSPAPRWPAFQSPSRGVADQPSRGVADQPSRAAGWQLVALRTDGWIFPGRPTRPAAPARAASADTLATDAYDALAQGRRRDAANGFAAAIAATPEDPRAAAWGRERDALRRRWSGSAYIMARNGPADLTRAPLLGGGQSGAMLAFTPDPLAAMPLALTLRGAVAHHGLGLDTASAQGAAGLRWQVLPGVALAAERRFGNRAGWSLRLAGGADGSIGRFAWSGYGEAGLVGADPFAAAQGFAGWRLPLHGFEAQLGGGIWGGVQDSGSTASRIDIGPSLRLRHEHWPVALAVDYRARVAGNALPDSGVAVTLSASF